MLCLLAATVGAERTPPVRSQSAPAAVAAPFHAPSRAALLQAAQPFMVNAAALADSGAFPHQGAVQLYHLRYEQVTPSGLSALVVQRVFQIRTAQAANGFALDDLWYDSSRTRFHLQCAQVLRGRRILNGADRGDLNPGASGNQPRSVSLPDLRPGDRINLVYVLSPDTSRNWTILGGRFLGNLFAFRDSFSTDQVKYVLAARSGVAVSQVGIAPPVVGRSPAGLTTWLWTAVRQPAFFHSPGGPAITDVSPFVQVSGFHSWAEMADWYSALLAGRAHLAPAFERHLLQVAQPLGFAPSSPPSAVQVRATVDRIWTYLGLHLGYAGNETGVHAYVPAPVEQIFHAQQGDCKDGALLLSTWLRALGIEADVALVRTPAMGRLASTGPPVAVQQHRAIGSNLEAPRAERAPVAEKSISGTRGPALLEPAPAAAALQVPATMAAFDHALVYIPATHEWLDTTAPGLLAGELPASDQGSLALIVRAGQRRLVRIPYASAAANLTRRTVRLSPLGNGWFRAQGELLVRGADAPEMRERYAYPSRNRGVLADWLGSYFPAVGVESVRVSGVTPASDTVRIDFTAKIHPHEFSVAWIQRNYARRLAMEAARNQSLHLPLRWRLDETWSLRLPNNAACTHWEAEPGPQPRHSSRFGDLSITTTCQDGWLNVHSVVSETALQIPAAEYTAFRGFWRSVDARLNAPLTPVATLRLASSMPPAPARSHPAPASSLDLVRGVASGGGPGWVATTAPVVHGLEGFDRRALLVAPPR